MFSAITEAYQAHLQYGDKRLLIKSMFINNVLTLISGWKRRHVAPDVKMKRGEKRRRRRRKRSRRKRRRRKRRRMPTLMCTINEVNV